jgi:Mg-chelatase subunit ChlD
MVVKYVRSRLAMNRSFHFVIIALVGFMTGTLSASHAEEKKPAPCTEDAMIVFDASGSMSGNQVLGIPNSRARIDEVRAALAQVLPTAAAHRRVGLITYGPGPYNQCNVKLDLKPTPDAAKLIMSAVNALVPAGKTPLTSGVEQAAEALDYRRKPGVIVVVTDGEETCGQIALRPGQAAPFGGRPAHRSRHRLPLRGLLLDRRQQRGRPNVPRQ